MSSKESGKQTLRLTQNALGEDQYRVEIALEGDSTPRRIGTSEFSFKLTAQDHEDIRWYLEDYLQYPLDPAPTIAGRIEKRIAEIGTELFKKIFPDNNHDTSEIWFAIRNKLNETRVEVITGVEEATAIPWELMRDPTADTSLALNARAFVRATHESSQTPKLPDTDSGPIRILLVICRPRGRDDVPFRSVASRLVKGLRDADRKSFQLDVLRPPTYENLAKKLRSAKDKEKPYHVVHFDGHGDLFDIKKLLENLKGKSDKAIEEYLRRHFDIIPEKFSPQEIYPHLPREGKRGYLLFNNPKSKLSLRFVDGQELGKLLWECGVSVLVLNACRSAHAEAPERPKTAHQKEERPQDIHAEIRAYGSLAQEVMDAGAAGVVAMRYSVYVFTAAQFVADLYSALAQGQTLGQAVTLGRKQLKDKPLREIAYDARPLQDWCVPIVHEAAPIALFPKPPEEAKLHIELKGEGTSTAEDERGIGLPPPPDVGFFGRDETLLALDRAFDTQPIILLHAYAGSGKTATAAEFARWYILTGGLGQQGLVLFTSFEQYKPLVRVLDQIEAVFGKALEASGIHWLTLEDEQRREVALQVLKQIPVLWIWDNVEPVTGFPAGTKSVWSKAEQKELADFLRAARDTKAKFLLTSRRDEKPWLHNLPVRVTLPPMPMQERVQLSRALAEKHQYRLTEVDDWRPLLRYTEGNPLTITALVGQALRDGLKTRDQIEDFVEKLRLGEAEFDDDISEGRSRSLGASLRYGFELAFTEDERKILALLHLFQGFVDVDVLKAMGNQKLERHLTEVYSLKREEGIKLLDRAAEIGLLTAHGGGYYSIHPALPWFFKSLFEAFYPSAASKDEESPAQRATRAFVEAIGKLGDYYHVQYISGNIDVIGVLTYEEANLLHAHRLARSGRWWHALLGPMEGLRNLYGHTGRRAEWKQLVKEVVPDFIDPVTDGPLSGREKEWNTISEYRITIANEDRQWEEAKRLLQLAVEWNRKRSAPALVIPAESLNDAQRNTIRWLALSLHGQAHIQTQLGEAECKRSFDEALDLFQRIGDEPAAAICAFNLGNAHMELPALKDLDQAERWYKQSLKLTAKRDRIGRAQSVGQLGLVAFIRFEEAKKANKSEDELLRHLNKTLKQYHEALELLPANAVNDLAVTHNQLGIIYANAGEMDRAVHHYNKSIQYKETSGDVFAAGNTRSNVALALMDAARYGDALLYARAALRNYETYGDRAAEKIQETKDLIAEIEEDLKIKERS